MDRQAPGPAPDAPAAVSSLAPAGGLRGLLHRHGVKLGASLVLGVGLAWILARGGLPLVPPPSAFAAFKPWTLGVYVLSLAVVHFLRAVRWRHLLRPVGGASLRSVIVVSWIAFGAIILSPLRSGEIVRPYLITRRSRVRFWEAAGTVGAERVIDGLVLSVVLFTGLQLAAPLSPLPDHIGSLPVPAAAVPKAAYAALVVFMSAFTLMGVFFFARDFARRATFAVIGVVSRDLAERFAAIVERVADGIRFLPSWRSTLPFLLETLGYWLANALGVQMLAWGVGLTTMTLAEAVVTIGCVGVGILVPAGPGYFGAFQLSTYMALAMYFPEAVLVGPGAAFVFLFYAVQILFHLVAMAVALLIDRGQPAAPFAEDRPGASAQA
jgi:uncharacterized protein (TIRG00374 family)